jgi:hypothetical protein
MILGGQPPGLTRECSERSLPTDHDYAVSTREYQSDQPSRFATSTVARAAWSNEEDERGTNTASLTSRFISAFHPGTGPAAHETRDGVKSIKRVRTEVGYSVVP